MSEDELTQRLASIKLKNAAREEAHRRAEADEASFRQREQQATIKRRVERANRMEMEGERERNRLRKMKAVQGREWDAEKDDARFSANASSHHDLNGTTRSQYRRGAHGGVVENYYQTLDGPRQGHDESRRGGFESSRAGGMRIRGGGDRGRGRGRGHGLRGRGGHAPQGYTVVPQATPRTNPLAADQFPALPSSSAATRTTTADTSTAKKGMPTRDAAPRTSSSSPPSAVEVNPHRRQENIPGPDSTTHDHPPQQESDHSTTVTQAMTTVAEDKNLRDGALAERLLAEHDYVIETEMENNCNGEIGDDDDGGGGDGGVVDGTWAEQAEIDQLSSTTT